MCRFLCVRAKEPFDPLPHLKAFAEIAKNSKEYQGHGWGCAIWTNNGFKLYKNISPIWEDRFPHFEKTTRLIAHARSAFRDEGVMIENNMPFGDETIVFVFNGELHGVRIKAEGRIGAEKIFTLLKRFHRGDWQDTLRRTMELIKVRTRYVKAMNMGVANGKGIWVASFFNEDPLYFTLHCKRIDEFSIVCSDPYLGETGWEKLPNGFIGEV